VSWVASSRGSRSPTATDAAVAIALLLAATSHLWLPALAALHQGSEAVAGGERPALPVTTIELVLDAPPTQEVTINGYHAVAKYQDGEGYHLVFVVPSNRTYALHPSCCSRLRYLTPGKRYYAYWLGGCVAVRTDR